MMVELTLKAKHDHLQKVASTRDFIKAISEFVWNALDADARNVIVELVRNASVGCKGSSFVTMVQVSADSAPSTISRV